MRSKNYKLTEKDFFVSLYKKWTITGLIQKKSYKKQKKDILKEKKAAEYYLQNKELVRRRKRQD